VEDINLDKLPLDGKRMLKELAEGNMVIARSRNDFLYILELDGGYQMFSHTAGAPGGGQKQFQKDEKNTAVIDKIADLSDSMFMAEFDKGFDLVSVMFTIEEAILSMFPPVDSYNGEMVDFGLPEDQ